MNMSTSWRHALAVLAMTICAGAAAAADMRVGVVDIDRLMRESPQGKVVQETLQAEFADRQRELLNQQKDLRALEERLNRDRAAMNAQERADIEARARTLQQRYQRQASEFEDDVNVRKNEELSKLQRVIVREVQAYAKDEHYDLLVGSGVLYAGPNADVTGAVLKRLEALAPQPSKAAADSAKPGGNMKK